MVPDSLESGMILVAYGCGRNPSLLSHLRLIQAGEHQPHNFSLGWAQAGPGCPPELQCVQPRVRSRFRGRLINQQVVEGGFGFKGAKSEGWAAYGRVKRYDLGRFNTALLGLALLSMEPPMGVLDETPDPVVGIGRELGLLSVWVEGLEGPNQTQYAFADQVIEIHEAIGVGVLGPQEAGHPVN